MTPPYVKEFIILAFGVQLKNDDEVEGKGGEPTQRLKNSPENVQNIWGGGSMVLLTAPTTMTTEMTTSLALTPMLPRYLTLFGFRSFSLVTEASLRRGAQISDSGWELN